MAISKGRVSVAGKKTGPMVNDEESDGDSEDAVAERLDVLRGLVALVFFARAHGAS